MEALSTSSRPDRDSAAHLSFGFDDKTPPDDAGSYVLYKVEPKIAAAK